MRSTTAGYLQIKLAYKSRYERDFAKINEIATQRSGRAVSKDLIQECIQRLTQIRVIDYTPLYLQNLDNFQPSGTSAVTTWQTYRAFQAVLQLRETLQRELDPSQDLSNLKNSLS